MSEEKIMKKLSESRIKRAEKSVKQRTEDRTFVLDLRDEELELLLSAAKSFSLDPDRLVTQLVKNWLRAGAKND